MGLEAAMKCTRASMAMAFLVIAPPALAQVNALPESPHILVYGSAQARALPDRFKLSIDISSTHLSAASARGRVAGLFDTVLRQLDAAGLAPGEIDATTLSIETSTRWNEQADQQVVVGMEVSRSIHALFDSLERLDGFLSDLETSSELTIGKVEAQLSSEPELRRQLRDKAIEDSRAKAMEIARAYGVELGALYSVSDVAPQFSYGVREGSWPRTYRWTSDGDGRTLDRVEVSGYRIDRESEQFRAGYIDFESKLYAVFRIDPSAAEVAPR